MALAHICFHKVKAGCTIVVFRIFAGVMYMRHSLLFRSCPCVWLRPKGQGNIAMLSAIMNDSVSMAYDRPGDSVPDDGCVRLRTRTKLPLSKLFNDINPQHIEVARRDESYLWIRLIKRGHRQGLSDRVNRIICGRTHASYPYLNRMRRVHLLAEIGRRFHDTLQRGCG